MPPACRSSRSICRAASTATSGAVMGAAVKASRDRDVLPPQAGPSAAAGTAALRAGRASPTSAFRTRVLDSIRPQTSSPTRRRSGPSAFRCRSPAATNIARGHAVVVSGDLSHTGAARLAARGALRAGAGLVTIASPRDALAVNAARNLAVMVRPVDGADELARILADPRLNAVVLGPGRRGRASRCASMVLAALGGRTGGGARRRRADELCRRRPKRCLPRSRSRAPSPTVLTPHEGEFARLFR